MSRKEFGEQGARKEVRSHRKFGCFTPPPGAASQHGGFTPRLSSPVAMLSSGLLVVSHQPHDQTEGLAVTPDGRYVFTNSRHCLYRSQDAGFVWEKANGRGLPHVAVPPCVSAAGQTGKARS